MRNPPLFAFVIVLSLLFVWRQPAAVSAGATDGLAPRQIDRQDDASAVQAPQATTASMPGWQRTVVDADGNGVTAIALDADGRVGISYHGPPVQEGDEGSRIRVSRREGDGWVREAVPFPDVWLGPTMGAVTALAFDAAGRSQIAFGQYNIITQQIYFATTNDEAVWTVPTLLDPAFASPSSISIAAGSDGYTRVTYCTQSRQTWEVELWYVELDPDFDSIWLKTPLGKEVCWGSTSVAVDDAGVPHIAYVSRSGRPDSEEEAVLKYAKRVGGEWSFETVHDTGAGVGSVSLAVTPEGIPHIGYQFTSQSGSSGLHEVRYATLDGEAWAIQTIAAMAVDGQALGGISLALDSAGRPYVAYVDLPIRTLRYAWLDGDEWQTTPVDVTSSGLGARALVLDSSGLPHLTYTVDGEGVVYTRFLPRTLPNQLSLPLMTSTAANESEP